MNSRKRVLRFIRGCTRYASKGVWLFLAILTAICAIGSTVFVVVARGALDESTSERFPAITVPVERRTLREVVTTRGTLGGRPLPELVAVGEGRVTSVVALAGEVVNVGDVLFEIEAEPVIAAGGDFPYWRNLSLGMVGEDVLQLERALAADGFSLDYPDGDFTTETNAAVSAWQQENGLPDDGVFRADRVLVADWPSRVTQTHVAVGVLVTPEMELFEIATQERVGNFSVSASDRSLLRPGQRIAITAVAGGEHLSGTVSQISTLPVDAPAVDGDAAETGLRYTVVATLDRDLDELPEGAAIRGDVVIREVNEVLAVPVAAVRSDSEGSPSVTIAIGGDRVQVAVALGVQEAGYVEVRSGLNGGELVVLELE